MKSKKANPPAACPATKRIKTDENLRKANNFEFDPANPLVSLPPDALTAVLCRSPASDHDALWRTCKTIRSTLDSDTLASERVSSGYAEIEARHVSKEELWQKDIGDDPEHDPTDEGYDAEESARLKEEALARYYSDLGSRDETYGYHDIHFDLKVDGMRRGSIHLVLVPRVGSRGFHAATDAAELQEVGWTLCDERGRPKVRSIKNADTNDTARKGGFLHVVSVRVAQPCRPSDNTDVASEALRLAITHPILEDKWTLATGIADAGVYYTEKDTKCKRLLNEAHIRRLGGQDSDDEHLAEQEEEKEMQKNMSKRCEECMNLDSRAFVRVGYKQIPEVIGYESTVNWFFALPPMLEAPILSSAEAFKVDLFELPTFPDKPQGADKKLLNLVTLACNDRRALLDARVERMCMLEAEHGKTVRLLEEVITTERELEGQASTMDNATVQTAREKINDMRTRLTERIASLATSIAKRREEAAKEDEKLKGVDKEFKETVETMIRVQGVSIRKAFVLHCASRHRLPVFFDILYELVPSNEKPVAINDIDFAGFTLLFTAAQSMPDQVSEANEQYEFVERLLELGADKNQTDFKGMSALGMYRSIARSRDELVDMFSSRSGVNQNEDSWKSKHEKMEELLMPVQGETEADRDAKKTSEPVFDLLSADDEEDD